MALKQIPWNKGKTDIYSKETLEKMRRAKYKTGIRHYRKKLFASVDVVACNRCSSVDNLLAHHIDEDRNNNKLDNLEIICKSCHAKEHDIGKHLPKDGGWSRRRLK